MFVGNLHSFLLVLLSLGPRVVSCIVVEHAAVTVGSSGAGTVVKEPPRDHDARKKVMRLEAAGHNKTKITAAKAVPRSSDDNEPPRAFVLGAGYFNRPRVRLEDPASGWKYMGPEPLPILEDNRLTYSQKVQELERIIAKLHDEFWIKKKKGYKSLALARNLYYEALEDYKFITTKGCPPSMECEELPAVRGSPPSASSLPATGSSSSSMAEHFSSHARENRTGAPDLSKLPACMSDAKDTAECKDPHEHCQSDQLIKLEDNETGDMTLLCACLVHWRVCAQVACSEEQQEEKEGFIQTLDAYEQEECYLRDDQDVMRHIGYDPELFHPWDVSSDKSDVLDGDEGGQTSLLQKQRREKLKALKAKARGSRSPGIGSEAVQAARRMLDSFDARHHLEELTGARPNINPPQGCQVSHPLNLGDGRCDHGVGSYNTQACNYDGGDCCQATCRSNVHICGDSGYTCEGTRDPVYWNDDEFECDLGKMDHFKDYVDELRDELVFGESTLSSDRCSEITAEEHDMNVQAYNVGVLMASKGHPVKQAVAQLGGRKMIINCELWDKQENTLDKPYFGTIITHEMGHVAGYGHPLYDENTFESECGSIGGDHDFCPDHCMEWLDACIVHMTHGSKTCGFGNMGCKTTCVRSEYCKSLPERITVCFGYEKVHSRRGLKDHQDRVNNALESVGAKLSSWFGWGGAHRSHSVALACMLLAAWPLTFVAEWNA